MSFDRASVARFLGSAFGGQKRCVSLTSVVLRDLRRYLQCFALRYPIDVFRKTDVLVLGFRFGVNDKQIREANLFIINTDLFFVLVSTEGRD